MNNDTVVIWLAIERGYEMTNARGCQVVDQKTIAQNLKYFNLILWVVHYQKDVRVKSTLKLDSPRMQLELWMSSYTLTHIVCI